MQKAVAQNAHQTHRRNRRATTAGTADTDPEMAPIVDATPADLLESLEWDTRRLLGISADEFLSRWFGGYYAADPDQPGVILCAMLAPFVEEYWRGNRQP